MTDWTELDDRAVAVARGLAADAVQRVGNGHPGTAMALAPAAYLLFQRFQRVELPNQPRHDGVGLGLVFVKTVIERHQGDIRFASTAGEGTTFTLTLPRCQPT